MIGMTDHEKHLAADSGHRAQYIQGLGHLAAALENHEDLPLPYEGNMAAVTLQYLHAPDPVAALAGAVKAIPCGFTSQIEDYTDYDASVYLYLRGKLDGLMIELVAFCEGTCEQDGGGWRIPEAITSIAPEAGDAEMAAAA